MLARVVRRAAAAAGLRRSAMSAAASAVAGAAARSSHTALLLRAAAATTVMPRRRTVATSALRPHFGGGTAASGATATTASSATASSSVNPDEVDKFSRMAREWWDVDGRFAPLHDLNPQRVLYVREQLCAHFFGRPTSTASSASSASSDGKARALPAVRPGTNGGYGPRPLSGLRVVDVGCGGGLVSESLARLGAHVLGVDASRENIGVARAHAALDPHVVHRVQYAHTTAEQLLAHGHASLPKSGHGGGAEQFDAVVSLEVIEHVVDPHAFVATLTRLLKPDGVLVLATLNRTCAARALAIGAVEYVLQWVPPGTHDWHKFLTPHELTHLVTTAHTVAPAATASSSSTGTTGTGDAAVAATLDVVTPTAPLEVMDITGLVYDPAPSHGPRGSTTHGRQWSFSATDCSINYMLTAAKRAASSS